jgi:signal transduction histidine kinase
MNLEILTTFIMMLANFFLVALILFFKKEKKFSKTIIWFIAFVFFLIFWKLTLTIYLLTQNLSLLDLWGRINFLSAILMVYSALNFVNYFPSEKDIILKNKHIKILITSVTFLLSYLTLFTKLITKAEVFLNGERVTLFGNFFFLYFFYLLLITGLTLFFLLQKLKKPRSSIFRRQVIIMLLGFSIAIIWAITTNLIASYFFKIFSLQQFGPLGTITITVVFFVSVIKYDFLETKVILSAIIYYLISAFVTILIYYGIANFMINFLGGINTYESIFVSIPVSLIFVYIYTSFINFLTRKLQNFLYPNLTKNLVNDFNMKINSIFDEATILKLFYQLVTQAISLRFIYIYKVSYGGKNILNKYFFGESLDDVVKNSFEVYIKKNGLSNNINLEYDAIEDDDFKKDFKDVALIKNILLGGTIYTILFGKKTSNSILTAFEYKTLDSFINILSLSLSRAALYQEVQEFNITLQKKIEEATTELKKKNLELADALRKERDMLDILGHELRTPIGTARNALFMLKVLLKKEKLTNKTVDKYLKIASDSVNREIKILESILSSAKIENDRLDLTFEEVNIKEVIDNSFNAYKIEAEKKELKLKVDLPAKQKLSVYGDRTGVQQIMDNLVSNAIKYTQRGSVVIFAKKNSDNVIFGTVDTGEGIHKSEIKNLGKKFYRINPYLHSEGKIENRNIIRPGGTGIGLYVVFNLVKNMNGKIEVESELGKGSTFKVSLPLYTGQEKKEIRKSDNTFQLSKKNKDS